MAHKLAGGTAKNTRDSKGQRLGVKKFGGESAKPGNIIIRQRGTKWHPGEGVLMGKDFTIFSIIEGVVEYSIKRKMKFNGRTYKNTVVSVVPKDKNLAKKEVKKVEKKTVEKKPVKKVSAKKPVKKVAAKKTEKK